MNHTHIFIDIILKMELSFLKANFVVLLNDNYVYMIIIFFLIRHLSAHILNLFEILLNTWMNVYSHTHVHIYSLLAVDIHIFAFIAVILTVMRLEMGTFWG